MKTLNLCISTAVILLSLFSSFTIKQDKNYYSAKDLQEITPLIENTIILYDTTKLLQGIKFAVTSKDYTERYKNQFLTYTAFNLLKLHLEKIFNDPGALIYSDAEANSVLKPEERKALPKGQVNAIRFFETWYYNKQTGEIVKKQLGYAVLQWDYKKQVFREWYLYFTSQEARLAYLKN